MQALVSAPPRRVTLLIGDVETLAASEAAPEA